VEVQNEMRNALFDDWLDAGDSHISGLAQLELRRLLFELNQPGLMHEQPK